MKREIDAFEKRLISCRKCPRLVAYLKSIKDQFPAYWCRPVPLFGDRSAKILLLGLAPGRYGSNRTGRMFTGDASGKFLFKALFDLGLANNEVSLDPVDDLRLSNVVITAVVRCAPPQNKPLPEEVKNCGFYFQREIELLKKVDVVVALGRIAHDAFIKFKEKKDGKIRRRDFSFKHGAAYRFGTSPHYLVDVYHPSRQNTQTGRLTMRMFKAGLKKAMAVANSHCAFA